MNASEKKELSLGFFVKGKSSIESVEKFSTTCDIEETDLRSLYVLLSYGFEMILKSVLISLCNSNPENCLKNLERLSHNLQKISGALGIQELTSIGISSITPQREPSNNPEHPFLCYCVYTTDGDVIYIDDFTNVRYPPFGVRTVEKEYIPKYATIIKKKIISKVGNKIDNINK